MHVDLFIWAELRAEVNASLCSSHYMFSHCIYNIHSFIHSLYILQAGEQESRQVGR